MLVLLFSAKVFSHTCHISLYDPYNRPYLNFHTELDDNCQTAAKQCYLAISQYRLNPYQYKCYTISMSPDPDLSPVNDQDYRRGIEMGETVIYRGKFWVTTFVQDNGLYQLKPEGGKERDIEKNIDRKDIIITRGCLRDICTKTSLISKTFRKYVSVEGIDYQGRYVVQEIGSKELILEVEFYNLARTSGCAEGRYEKVCTGNRILVRDTNYHSRYYEVSGIQTDRLLVIKDEEGLLHFNVDPRTVQVIR